MSKPASNIKMWLYRLAIDWLTVEALKHFPCHYGLIDAYWSADGLLGLKADYSPCHTKTIIGGDGIIAVEWVGAKKMGLDPHNSRIFNPGVRSRSIMMLNTG